MNPTDMINAFAEARSIPEAAIQWARANWGLAGPALRTLATNYANGRDRSDRAGDALFFGLLMFADRGETGAFETLCALARDPEALARILGDGTTMSLKQMVTRLWGGNEAGVKEVMNCSRAEPYSRGAFFEAYVYLALTGAVSCDDARAFLLDLHGRLTPEDDPFVWYSWADAALNTGVEGALGLIKTACDAGWIDITFADYDEFADQHADLANDRTAAVARLIDQEGPITDALVELSKYSFTDDEWDDDHSSLTRQEPLLNPYRDIGRNDPCPCGSGKKFKKCCLPKFEAENLLH